MKRLREAGLPDEDGEPPREQSFQEIDDLEEVFTSSPEVGPESPSAGEGDASLPEATPPADEMIARTTEAPPAQLLVLTESEATPARLAEIGDGVIGLIQDNGLRVRAKVVDGAIVSVVSAAGSSSAVRAETPQSNGGSGRPAPRVGARSPVAIDATGNPSAPTRGRGNPGATVAALSNAIPNPRKI